MSLFCNQDTNVKACLLITMCSNIVLYNLLTSYVRQMTQGPLYFPTTLVFLAELVKLSVSVVMLFRSCAWSVRRLKVLFGKEILNKPKEFMKLAIPAGLYAIQNNLVQVALSNLDPATYQVTSHMKVFTTVVFMRAILRRQFLWIQWSAICLLFFGVVLVQLHAGIFSYSKSGHYLMGLTSVIIICICAGFAGVYFEKLLKETSVPFWIRNLEMYLWGLLTSAIGIICYDLDSIVENGFFYGYTSAVWVIVGLSGAGGLYASLVIGYLDNIFKIFTSCTAIVLTSLSSSLIFKTDLGISFILGSSLVCISMYFYSKGNMSQVALSLGANKRNTVARTQ
ncbi:CMP-sialic acid transporter-like isoform X2 [Tachypleus tridentatus]|uniref:CMP-sialic acid transporter-like isoform X2 n=1 Tax=Tachypleus tridentatus TaxID=6853 RepID=UPI003FD0F378